METAKWHRHHAHLLTARGDEEANRLLTAGSGQWTDTSEFLPLRIFPTMGLKFCQTNAFL